MSLSLILLPHGPYALGSLYMFAETNEFIYLLLIASSIHHYCSGCFVLHPCQFFFESSWFLRICYSITLWHWITALKPPSCVRLDFARADGSSHWNVTLLWVLTLKCQPAIADHLFNSFQHWKINTFFVFFYCLVFLAFFGGGRGDEMCDFRASEFLH